MDLTSGTSELRLLKVPINNLNKIGANLNELDLLTTAIVMELLAFDHCNDFAY